MNHQGFLKRDKLTGSLLANYRDSSESKLSDFRKSQDAKRQWKLHGREMLKSINDFHGSTAGKQFHRKLNRLLEK